MSNSQDNTVAKRVYTVEEISEILGISRSAAYDLVKKGEFKAVRIGATIRISKPSFDAWLDSREI
ncbi:MAG: helix-turn-helix domain-containing protein [Candidatus Gastranaerophilaceae bacterium]